MNVKSLFLEYQIIVIFFIVAIFTISSLKLISMIGSRKVNSITVLYEYDTLKLARRFSFSFPAIVLMFVVALLYVGMFNYKEVLGSLEGIQKVTFLLFVFGLGIVGTYVILVNVFNKECLEISPKKIKYSHKPLPAVSNKEVDVSTIKEFIKEPIVSISYEKFIPPLFYNLKVKLSDGREIKIAAEVKKKEIDFLVDKIDKHLKNYNIYIPVNEKDKTDIRLLSL